MEKTKELKIEELEQVNGGEGICVLFSYAPIIEQYGMVDFLDRRIEA